MRLIKWLALFLYRSSRELAAGENRSAIRAKYIAYGAILLGTFSLFAILLGNEALRWKNTSPEFVLEPKSWRFVIDDGPLSQSNPSICQTEAFVNYECPVHPQNPKLWQSPLTRFDETYYKHFRSFSQSRFWIGASIEPQVVKQISDAGANHLILGWIKGHYKLWIDGEFITEGSREDREPIVLALPRGMFVETKPLQIALEVLPEKGAAFPDILARPLKEGFGVKAQARAYKSISSFWKKSRPFALFFMNLLFSFLFFLLWHSEREKQEYFYISSYALMSAVFQLRLTDLFLSAFDPNVNYSLDILLRFSEGSLGLFLGLAFARSRREFFQWGISLCVILPSIVAFSLSDGPSKYRFNDFLDQWLVPVFYLLGAAACALQAVLLFSYRNKKQAVPVRMKRLIYFSIGLGGVALTYILQSHHLVSFVHRMFLSRFAHFGLVLFLGVIALFEYREQKKLLKKTPLSQYHQRPVLPEKLFGVILCVDIKRSELLFSRFARQSNPARLMEACLSHLWSSAAEKGAVILQTEGDQIKLFFDSANCADPVEAALEATDLMMKRLGVLHGQFVAQNWISVQCERIEFRAAISSGAIKPVWQEVGGTRLGAWAEVDESRPFIENARLIEIERALNHDESIVLIPEELAKQVAGSSKPKFRDRFLFRAQNHAAKHGQIYCVSAFVPRAESTGAALAA
ncbi:MAG: hypothetical protein AB1540_00205 [Bdellovibrionota bacterium]